MKLNNIVSINDIPLIKPFRTLDRFYIYDTITSIISEIDVTTYNILRRLVESKCDEFKMDLRVKQELDESRMKYGLFSFRRPKVFAFPMDEDELKYLVNKEIGYCNGEASSQMRLLLLEITNKCNFNCRYCNNNRKIKAKDMTQHIARKAIDLYMESSNNNKELCISFYGGEPLLNMSLIEYICEYANNKNKNSRNLPLNYRITTNGFLLHKTNIDLLFKYNMRISISLDGPEEIHNNNRKLINGFPTFETVWRNIKYLANTYPKYFDRNVSFYVTYCPENKRDDMQDIINFFRGHDIFKNNYIRLIIAGGIKSKEVIQYALQKYYEAYFSYIEEIINKGSMCINDSGPNICNSEFLPRLQNIHERHIQQKEYDYVHLNGQCVPGGPRIFVSCYGNIYSCERNNAILLGDVDQGFSIAEIVNLLKNYNKFVSVECSKCWAIHLCKMCLAQISEGIKNNIKIDKKVFRSLCASKKQQIAFDLAAYCYIREKKPEALNGFKITKNR